MAILLADHCSLSKVGLSTVVKEVYPSSHIIDIDNWQDLKEILGRHIARIELIIVEIFMPNNQLWHESIADITKRYPHMPILIITSSYDKSNIQKAMQIGVKGYLLKTTAIHNIKHCIAALLKGKHCYSADLWEAFHTSSPKTSLLTARQQEILDLIIEGFSNKIIAKKLQVTENTVKRHISNIYERLNVKNRVEAVQFAQHQLGYE